MALLPIYRDEQLQDGCYIHALPTCLEKCKSEKCIAHYKKVVEKNTGFYTCPYGLSTLVYKNSSGAACVFSSLRERTTYNKKQAALLQAKYKIYNPILDSEELVALAQDECDRQDREQSFEQKIEEVNDLLHEARKLNGQIKTECDVIWENSSAGTEYDAEGLLEFIRKIHIYSFIVYNRFQYFDTILNPMLSVGAAYNAIVFKKLDKMRKLLKGYGRKNVWISLEGQSTYGYRVYQSFETLLFIILENAIKYSPDNNPITINFEEENENILDVTIQSTGPYCRSEEIKMLGTKGFRGEEAKRLDSTGQGIGLNFAKKICEQHNIQIDFDSSYKGRNHGIVYGTFIVKLHFDRVAQPK